MIPALLSLIIAFSISAVAIVQITMDNFFVVGNIIKSQQSFNIAEAGLNYYLWHLNHNNTDYKDGKTTPTTPDPQLGYGPYVHDYVDNTGKVLGTYTLWLKPTGSGSTVVKVRSIGQASGSDIKRTVEAQIGSPSFANYGVVSDSALWFGSTESADGPVHSNQGIRLDGANTSTASAASATYTPSSNLGGNGSAKPGVWCHTSVTSPVNCNTRSKTDWLFPVSSVDFNQVSSSLCDIKKAAFAADSSTASLATLSNACSQLPVSRTATYLPRRNATFNLTRGYLIQLNANGTYDLYSVSGENDLAANYSSALTLSSLQTGITIPAAGVIFAEDNVWVRSNPTYHGRVTIASGRLTAPGPASYTNIVVADDLAYSTKNGADAIGLVSQDSVLIAPYAPPNSGSFNFEVDAAVLAQTGEVWYPGRYRTDSYRCTRGWGNSNQTYTFYGSVATRQTWTWTWLQTGANCNLSDTVLVSGDRISGILNNSTQYDYNLRYAPPPSYPLTAGYNFLSWREVLTGP